MAILKDIEVRIARNISGNVYAEHAGDALQEYERPTATYNESSDFVEKYVEAVTGQAFQIEVYLRAGFKFYAAQGILFYLMIDDDTVSFCQYYTRLEVEERQASGEPFIISSYPCSKGTRYFRMIFTFGSLTLDEKLDVDQDLADSQAEKKGLIVVGVERALSKRLRKPRPYDLSRVYNPTASVNVAKEVYKDRHIRQSVMPGLEVEQGTPGMETHEHVPYRQHMSKKLQVMFRYRDYLGLEILGCNPKGTIQALPVTEPISIEGGPDDSDIKADEGKEVGGRDGVSEVVTLRAEIERLQSFERETAELKHTIEGLNQEVASLKTIKDQMGALIGNLTGSNTASTPRSLTPNIKPDVDKERVKKEPSEGRPSPWSGQKERPAKRPRTSVELD